MNLRKRWWLVLCVASAVGIGPAVAQDVKENATPQAAQQEDLEALDEALEDLEPITETITGEIVDAYAYLVKLEKGEASQAGIADGNLPGILETDTELLYLVVAPGGKPANALVAPHAGKPVSITGKVYEGDGVILLEAEKIEPAVE